MSDVYVNERGQKVLATKFTALNAEIKLAVMAYFPAGSPKGTQPLYPNKKFLLSVPVRPGFAFAISRDEKDNQKFIELEVGDWLVVPLYSSKREPVDPMSVPDELFHQQYKLKASHHEQSSTVP